MTRLKTIALLIAAAALLAVPAIGQANHGSPHGKAKGKAKAKTKGKGKTRDRCTVHKGYVVKGTLTNYTGPNNESVTISVTGANKHARVSGELTDTNTNQDGVQVSGGSYTVDHVNPEDAFSVVFSGYDDAADRTTTASDKVRIIGKVAVTKRKCEPNASLEDRYDAVDVRKVKIVDAD